MDLSDNPPAFPVNWAEHDGSGMTLRDWFAGQALLRVHAESGRYGPEGAAQVAASSYAIADAMLATRKDTSHAE